MGYITAKSELSFHGCEKPGSFSAASRQLPGAAASPTQSHLCPRLIPILQPLLAGQLLQPGPTWGPSLNSCQFVHVSYWGGLKTGHYILRSHEWGAEEDNITPRWTDRAPAAWSLLAPVWLVVHQGDSTSCRAAPHPSHPQPSPLQGYPLRDPGVCIDPPWISQDCCWLIPPAQLAPEVERRVVVAPEVILLILYMPWNPFSAFLKAAPGSDDFLKWSWQAAAERRARPFPTEVQLLCFWFILLFCKWHILKVKKINTKLSDVA